MKMDRVPRRRVAILFHESEALGAGISVLRAATRLRTAGWSFVGWFPGSGPLPIESAELLDGYAERPKPIAFSRRGWRSAPGVRVRIARTPAYLRAVSAWLRSENPDVVHANSLLTVPEATVARRLGLPVVMQVHELRPHGVKHAATIRWAAAVSDVLVGVSAPVSTMLRLHAGRTPVHTVRNGVDVPDAARSERGAIVGTVGYVSRTKGTDLFLRAATLALRARPDMRFEHVGQARLWGDDAFDRKVEELARSPALRSRVALLGRGSVPDALARWEMFVLSSRSEAFPLSTLEAMAAGLPVIAANVGGIPEQITHLETGVLVPAEDAGALAEWIVRLHDDPDHRRRLGDAARRRVRERFSVDAQAEGLAMAYEEAVRRRGGR
jgi:glycosyltransferase involved in cell wall biosynthesis